MSSIQIAVVGLGRMVHIYPHLRVLHYCANVYPGQAPCAYIALPSPTGKGGGSLQYRC